MVLLLSMEKIATNVRQLGQFHLTATSKGILPVYHTESWLSASRPLQLAMLKEASCKLADPELPNSRIYVLRLLFVGDY